MNQHSPAGPHYSIAPTIPRLQVDPVKSHCRTETRVPLYRSWADGTEVWKAVNVSPAAYPSIHACVALVIWG